MAKRLHSQRGSGTSAGSGGKKLDFLEAEEPPCSVLSRRAQEMAASSLGQFTATVLDAAPENPSYVPRSSALPRGPWMSRYHLNKLHSRFIRVSSVACSKGPWLECLLRLCYNTHSLWEVFSGRATFRLSSKGCIRFDQPKWRGKRNSIVGKGTSSTKALWYERWANQCAEELNEVGR